MEVDQTHVTQAEEVKAAQNNVLFEPAIYANPPELE